MIVALLIAILLVQIAHTVWARSASRRLIHAALARTPAEYAELVRPVRRVR